MDKNLVRDMDLWRAGLIALPKAYIAVHKAAAEKSVPALAAKFGLRILTTEMVGDGWMDGMKVLRVIAEDKSGKLRDFRWSDSGNSWFEKTPSGGAALVFTPEKSETPGVRIVMPLKD